MGAKKVWSLTLLFFIAFCQPVFADIEESYLKKQKSVSLRGGVQVYSSSSMTDAWDIETGSMDAGFGEIGCEYKIRHNMGIELSLGFAQMNVENTSAYFAQDSAKHTFSNTYLSPSIKYYVPLKNRFSLYAGAGPDIFYTSANYEYLYGPPVYESSDSFVTFGAHAMIGARYYLLVKSTPKTYDWPVSVDVQYKYTYAKISEADSDIMSAINAATGSTLGANDLKIGGHMFSLGVAWHF